MRVWLQAIVLCLCMSQASAGAWSRDPGSGFVSLGFEVATTRSALSTQGLQNDPSPDFTGYRSLYAEFGVAPRLTLGVDAGQDDADNGAWAGRQLMSQFISLPRTTGEEDATDWPQRPTWSGVAFMRYALAAPGARHQFAVQLGIGARSYEQSGLYYGLEKMVQELIVRPAAAWGMGFDGPLGPGWLSLDASIELRRKTGGHAVKLDAMAGLSPEGRYTYFLQLQTGEYPNAAPFAKLVPGVAIHLWDGVSLETSAIWGLNGTDAVGTKAAIWIEW
ncbi:hypothetical protein [Meridianimarinicoccus aquatilis]|uniref:Transporter n=1 Tax=Meridianimarinicoccus aquatilis TaxID=2552766 RepID=A0A4V3BBS5_9RHOB|nr:hypothetical protein [Fluviibacterium aquatile]TDL88109.1 hypothetical protein E2L05_09415 [Fluviibacterium aquatile]